MILTKQQIDNWKETANGKFALMGNIAIGGLGHLNDLLESIADLESRLKAATEMGPCGHPKMFMKEEEGGPVVAHVYCTLCTEVQEARDAAIINPNGAFTERVRKLVLAPAECGVSGHFKFQMNGASCLQCQAISRCKSAAYERGKRDAEEGIEK